MLVFFTNFSLMEFQVKYLALFRFFLVVYDFKWFWSGPQVFIFGLTLFQVHINGLPHDVICDIAVYADDITLYS